MAMRNPHQLRMRVRQNALICDELADEQLQPERRAIFLRTAEHYRVLADKMDQPRQKWEALVKSYGLTPWEDPMPYRTNADLPPPIQRHLPSEAQDIYREAFNRAFAAQFGDPHQEEVAHRTAWVAVKRTYVKVSESWSLPSICLSLEFNRAIQARSGAARLN
jgi:cation transport regulator